MNTTSTEKDGSFTDGIAAVPSGIQGDQASALRDLVANQSGEKKVRVLGVCSGKGGVGKTCISVNLACLLARRGQRVLLLDADLGLANAEVLLGIQPRYHIGDLLSGRSIHEVIVAGPPGLRILPGGSGIFQLAELTDDQKHHLLLAIDAMERSFDIMVIDVGAGIGSNVQFFATAAHQTLLVVTPEPTSLADAYATAKVLSERGVESLDVVINQAPNEREARAVFRALFDTASTRLSCRLYYAGAVPRDPAVGDAVIARRPFVEIHPRAPASNAIESLARHVVATPARGNGGGFKFLRSQMWAASAT
jgi:flagellar biosynthesis protein FlhG